MRETISPEWGYLSLVLKGEETSMWKPNYRQKENLVKLCYDVIKLIVGGIAAADILQKNIPKANSWIAFGICLVLLVAALILGKDKQVIDSEKEKKGGAVDYQNGLLI